MIKRSLTAKSLQMVYLSLLGISAAIVILYVCFYNLGRPFSRADEVMYVRGTQGMLARGSLLVPYLDDQPVFNKPPMVHWLSLASIQAFGESVVTHRLPSAIAGLCAFIVVGFLTLYLSRSPLAAWLAVIGLAGCAILSGTNGFQTVGVESTLSLLTILVLWFLYDLSNELLEGSTSSAKIRKRSVAAGFFFALGVLTKSVAIGITLPIICIYILIRRYQLGVSWQALLKRSLGPIALFIVCAASLSVLYFGYLALAHPEAFGVLFEQEIVKRISRGYHHRKDTGFYFRLLFVSRRVCAPELLVMALLYAMWAIRRKHSRELTFLLVWSVVPVLAFTCVPSRLPWYIFPAIPAIVMLIAISAREIGGALASHSRISSPLARVALTSAWAVVVSLSMGSTFPSVAKRLGREGAVPVDVVLQDVREQLDGALSTYVPHTVQFDRQEVAYVQFLRPEQISADPQRIEALLHEKSPVLVIASLDVVGNLPSMAGWSGYSVIRPWKERQKPLVVLLRVDQSAALPAQFKSFSRVISGAEFVAWLKGRPQS